ncbi:hypothetical protein C5E06_09485 [Pseudoclavibacter sp. RFBI5]|nr:hypothetical protein C5E06_09485 [Pseudoclavibacter sp. RFBI5]
MGYLIRADAASSAKFVSTDPISREKTRATAHRLVLLMQQARAVSSSRNQPHLGDIPPRFASDSWTLGAQIALETGLPLWCDDRMTRQLLESSGIRSFSTVELIVEAQIRQWITYAEAQLLLSHLLGQWIIDVPFDTTTYSLAIDPEQKRPSPVLAALERSGPGQANEKVDFYMASAKRLVADPEQLGAWSASSTRYVATLANDMNGLTELLGLLMHRFLTADWLDPSQVALAIAGLHAESPVSQLKLIEAVLPRVFKHMALSVGVEAALRDLRYRSSQLPDEERLAILEVMLTTSVVGSAEPTPGA